MQYIRLYVHVHGLSVQYTKHTYYTEKNVPDGPFFSMQVTNNIFAIQLLSTILELSHLLYEVVLMYIYKHTEFSLQVAQW